MQRSVDTLIYEGAKIQTYRLEPSGGIPNHPALPVVMYEGVLRDTYRVADLFERNGWGGFWRAGVFPFHHYHSNAHEVLGCVGGSAVLLLGGPGGLSVGMSAGDVLLLPAGTGHCRKSERDGFSVVGAYPRGQENYDLIREGHMDVEDAHERIRRVRLPETDPVFRDRGPVIEHWRG